MDGLGIALEKLKPKLILAFKFNLRDLADLMKAEGFLSKHDHETVTAPDLNHNKSVKAGIMVESLIDKVGIHPDNYQRFLALVEPWKSNFPDVVELLNSSESNMHT